MSPIKFMSTQANALRRMPRNNFENNTMLVQVMAWCRKATRHYYTKVDQELSRQMASRGYYELKSYWEITFCKHDFLYLPRIFGLFHE